MVAETLELHKQDLTLMIDARYHKDLVVKNTILCPTGKEELEELVIDSLMKLPEDLHDFS